MSSKWKNAPIFYMTAQVRFGAVLTMGDFVSGIQSRLRHEFPDFSTQQLHQFELQLGNNSAGPEPKTTSSLRWHFKNLETTAGYVLAADSLCFHTTDYSTSEEFISRMLSGLELVNEQVGLAYVESIGIRSLDAIVPNDGHSIDFYIKANVRGLYGKLDGEFKHCILEAVVEQSVGRLVSRVVTLKGGLGISAELMPFALKIREDLQNLSGVHVVIDNDCQKVERLPFDLTKVSDRLTLLKRAISDAFLEAVTDEAVSYWKGESI